MSSYVKYANSRDLSYSEVACVTVLTWDVLIMFSDEVRVMVLFPSKILTGSLDRASMEVNLPLPRRVAPAHILCRRAWTPAKVMYLIARYMPWLVQL